jgi:uncharacterized protein with von Willebrand factor type A (vWA) domain
LVHNSALYEWNYQKQLLAIKIQEGSDKTVEEKERYVFGSDFLLRRPLLQSILCEERAPVLLVDEIDRADEAFEALLLELLAEYQITIPELGTIRAKTTPHVILTSNGSRELSDALKRRCLYHWIDYPNLEKELEIVRVKLPEIAHDLCSEAVRFVHAIRGLELSKRPGIAETIDLSRFCSRRRTWIEKVPKKHWGAFLNLPTTFRKSGLKGLTEFCTERAEMSRPDPIKPAGTMNSRADTPEVDMDPARFSTKSIVEFCRFARLNGVIVGVSETIDAIRAAHAVGEGDPEAIRFALRAILCSSPEDWTLFEALFNGFWRTAGSSEENRAKSPAHRLTAPQRAGREKISGLSPEIGNTSEREPENKGKTFSGASAVQRLREVDFSNIEQTELAALERLSVRLLKRMSHRVAKKLRPRKYRYAIDLRRTLRKAVSRGGELIDLRYKGPKKERPRLVILLDVSDSMNVYSFFLLKFAYTLGRRSKNVRSFVFSTALVDVSEILRTRRMSDALKSLATMTAAWSGGTRIGGSLHEFNQSYAPRLISRHSTGNRKCMLPRALDPLQLIH